MSPDAEAGDGTLAPDQAFAVLGNETRMAILQDLAEAAGPLSFSELRERVGVSDSGQFNYHLGKLEGHFLNKIDGEYSLRQAGRRVIESVLSGAVTEASVIEPTRLDEPCPYCGANIEISFREERLLIRCTECPGTFPGKTSTSPAFGDLPEGAITLYNLPSAGLEGRTTREQLHAVLAYTFSEQMALGNGVCPRCSGSIEFELVLCERHEADGDYCERCNSRFPMVVVSECVNCGYLSKGTMRFYLSANPTVRSFFEARGIDPIAPEWEDMSLLYNREETVTGTDPFEAEIVYRLDGDELEVTIDENLSVVAVTERISREIES